MTSRFSLCFVFFALCAASASEFKPQQAFELREEAREMFYHAYDSYMENAFPDDELKPKSCTGRRRDGKNPRGTMDDALGDFSLTLVDSMDTLVVLGDYEEFKRAVDNTTMRVSFDRDVTVNLFEVNIRMLGGLLSSHILASQLQKEDLSGSSNGYLHAYRAKIANELKELSRTSSLSLHQQRIIDQVEKNSVGFCYYQGELLELALDLGIRLLPAFQSPSGIPFSKVNLRYGMVHQEDSTCLAGAGTLSLEFLTLSNLSGYKIFGDVAMRSLRGLCGLQNARGLVPGMINVKLGVASSTSSSIGAGSDSFYEYLFKTWVVTGDSKIGQCFTSSYEAIETYMKVGSYYYTVNSESGKKYGSGIDSLQSFFPGLQVLIGNTKKAIGAHHKLWTIWDRFKFMPESYYPETQRVNLNYDDYPLRPEFIESTYFLYQATSHNFYRRVGERVLRNIQQYTRLPCGFASIGVSDGRLDDRMDSFFLSETVKYLYLLFDEGHWASEGFLFTTEAHPLPFSPSTAYSGPSVSPKDFKKPTEEELKELDAYEEKYFIKNKHTEEELKLDFFDPQVFTPVITLIPEHIIITLQVSEAKAVVLNSKFLFDDDVIIFENLKDELSSVRFVVADPIVACGELTNFEDFSATVAVIQKGDDCELHEMIFNVQKHQPIAIVVVDNDETATSVWESNLVIDERHKELITVPICGIAFKDANDIFLQDNNQLLGKIEVTHEPQVLISVPESVSKGNALFEIIEQVQNVLNSASGTDEILESFAAISAPGDQQIHCSDDYCTEE